MRQTSVSRDAIAGVKKLYQFFDRLADSVIKDHLVEKRPEQPLQSFLSEIVKFSGGVAAGLYQVDNRTVRLAGAHLYPEQLRRFLAEQKLSESHLNKTVRKGDTVVLKTADKKIFPIQAVKHVRFGRLPITHFPVFDQQRVVGVVELIGGALSENDAKAKLLSKRIGHYAFFLLQASRKFQKHAMSPEEFEVSMEAMADGVTIVRDLKILYTNSALKRMFGYDEGDKIVGRRIETIIAPEDRERVVERSRSRIAGKNVPNRYEYKAARKNGTLFDMEVVVSTIQFRGGKASVAVHRDITLKRAIEKELQQSEQMFRNVIDGVLTVGDALVLTNLEGKVLQVNIEFERLTGIKRSEAIGKEFPYEWLLEEEMSRYVLWIKELREKKSLRDFDIHWKGTDGRMISVSMNTTLLYNALNRPVAMMNMARDITERKNLEEENRLQFERLRVLYELSRTLTSLLKVNEIVEAVHRHLVEVLPFDAFFIDLYDEGTGTVRNVICYDTIGNLKVRIQPDSGESPLRQGTGITKVIAAKKSLLENRTETSTEVMEYPFGDKERRSLSLLYIPMFSKDKTIGVLSMQSYTPNLYKESHIRLLESFANLAAIALEKAKLYEETISKSIQLQNRNKELDDFTYVVSHDLKEPLIAVEGYSRVLLKDHVHEKNSAASEYISSIIQSCARMKGLIDDLLVLSRVSRLSELMEDVSLNEILSEVLDDLKFSLQEKHVALVLPEQAVSYRCNPTQIKLVLRNLISNAIKFNKSENPVIKIGLDQGEKRILGSVQDNGIGIEKRFFDKIFVIFQRIHPEYEGSGAGLAIVKKIVELYQGQIWLESEIGKGTTFYFSLPT
ncbi:MAG: PAS domain S-box protein [Bacteroidota bacterium]